MKRRIVEIDEAKCNGCGACANACHEGAIAMVNGKAHLMRDDYCDGFGDCLPHCPTGAITFVEREAVFPLPTRLPCRLPSSIKRPTPAPAVRPAPSAAAPAVWPRPLHPDAETTAATPETAPPAAPVAGADQTGAHQRPYFDGAKLLIAADCTAYALRGFPPEVHPRAHSCGGLPQAGRCGYSEKLTRIIRDNDIKEVTVVRMEVPCCGGLENALSAPCKASGKVPALAGDHLYRWRYSGPWRLPLNRQNHCDKIRMPRREIVSRRGFLRELLPEERQKGINIAFCREILSALCRRRGSKRLRRINGVRKL